MSVIIRLQNLPWSANALDIRQYFRGLSIPEGGVHIVGGELGDAFIAFSSLVITNSEIKFDSTDEDARQAFQRNNGKIKGVQIQLLLSSRTEMQRIIEEARNAQTPFLQAVAATPAPAVVPPVGSVTAAVTVSDHKKDDRDSKPRDDARNKRERSRRRSRSRSKSRDRKDRSRDRRDRRRRERSRSRDRRDRRRDRRERSRTRDRTRSKEREVRRVSRDDRRDSSRSADRSTGDLVEPVAKVNSLVWEQTGMGSGGVSVTAPAPMKPQQSLLGNFPGSTSSTLEDARRSLGLIANIQNALAQPTDAFQRNDINNTSVPARDSWQRNTRFSDRNTPGAPLSMDMSAQFRANAPLRPMLGQTNLNTNNPQIENRPNIFGGGQGLRMPYSENQMGMVRPFPGRPERGNHFGMERKEDGFRRDRNSQYRSEHCVQVRPYFGGYGELRKFFHGLFINSTGMKFVTDHSGNRTGLVYVRFVRPESKEQALARSGMLVRGAPLEVLPLDDEDFDKYGDEDHDIPHDDNQDTSGSPASSDFSSVVVENIPEFTKENHIFTMFSEYAINTVQLTVDEHYSPVAHVNFDKSEDAIDAVKKSAWTIAGKTVTVRPMCGADYKNGEGDYQAGSPQTHTDVVLLSGMPHKTSERDVVDFFSDIGLVPTRIHMLLGKFGPSGECYCEFNTSDEANAALDKNGMPLGAGTVRVSLCPRRDMERILGMAAGGPGPHQPRFPARFGPRAPVLMGPRPPHNMMRRRPPPPSIRFDVPAEPVGPPGCMVTMENVPFKAGVSEILSFFGAFDLSNQNVMRRFTDTGAPTGDARVTFSSPAEARRAVDECNKRKIRDRTIYLRVL